MPLHPVTSKDAEARRRQLAWATERHRALIRRERWLYRAKVFALGVVLGVIFSYATGIAHCEEVSEGCEQVTWRGLPVTVTAALSGVGNGHSSSSAHPSEESSTEPISPRAPSMGAQEGSSASSVTHRHVSAAKPLLIYGAAGALDLASTRYLQSRPGGREAWLPQSLEGQTAIKGLAVSACVLGDVWLQRRKPGLARVFRVAIPALWIGAAAMNVRTAR